MWRRLIYHPEVNYALRQTIVLCLPVAVGLLFGSLQNGLLFSLVPACCNIAGLDTLHKRFFKRLAVGGLLRKNAHTALERDQDALRLLLQPAPQPAALAYARMKVNQAHNALFTSLSQAMREPAFNSRYLSDMRLWVTHSQFIVEHINAMTILARDHYMLTPALAQKYLESCEIALQRCQQRLEYDGPGAGSPAMDGSGAAPELPGTLMERHLRRILSHLGVMHTISSVTWRQRPQHGRWLSRRLSD